MKTLIIITMLTLAACSSLVKCEDANTIAGPRTYCLGKVAGDGQEGVFRDVFSNKGLEAAQLHGGSSLWGQALVGAVAAGELAGGAIGAAALVRPPTSTSINRQDQGQLQGQLQDQRQDSTNVNTNVNSNTNTNTNKQRQDLNHTSSIINKNIAIGGRGGAGGQGGQGGSGCQGNCGDNNHDNNH